jgi:hypothetical protein
MRRFPFALVLALAVGPALGFADETKKDDPEKGGAKPEAAEASGIQWLHDVDEGRKAAQEAKKGLFVYMTPKWFT